MDQLAARQHGAVAHRQAVSCGLTADQIRDRVAGGRWIRAVRGVYRVAGAPVTWQQHLMAAYLAAPPGGIVSHFNAAAIYGLWRPPALPHLTVPPGSSARLPIARVHRASLAPQDVAVVGPFRTARPARLIVECAPLLRERALADLVDYAFCRHLADVGGVEAALERVGSARGRSGAVCLREVLSAWSPGLEPGSPAEMRLLRRIREWGFPEPERQIEVFDLQGNFVGRADLGWRDERVLVEYDSDRFHNPRRWSSDENRAVGFEAAGWAVRHAGKPDLHPSADGLRHRLDHAFGGARRRPG